MVHAWSLPVSDDLAERRAGGRRHYNALRHLRAEIRRTKLIRFLLAHDFEYGSQARAAVALGVSPATISRDVRILRSWWQHQGGIVWPADIRTPKAAARIITRMCNRT